MYSPMYLLFSYKQSQEASITSALHINVTDDPDSNIPKRKFNELVSTIDTCYYTYYHYGVHSLRALPLIVLTHS